MRSSGPPLSPRKSDEYHDRSRRRRIPRKSLGCGINPARAFRAQTAGKTAQVLLQDRGACDSLRAEKTALIQVKFELNKAIGSESGERT
jgi:hypothetical protein